MSTTTLSIGAAAVTVAVAALWTHPGSPLHASKPWGLPHTAMPQPAPPEAGNELWRSYRPGSGIEVLEKLHATRLAPTASNVNGLLSVMHAPETPAAEKVILSDIARTMYYDSADTGMRQLIAASLRDAFLESTDPVAGAGFSTSYALLYWQADTAEVLRQAHALNYLDAQKYHSFLANALPGAPQAEQPALIRIVSGSRQGVNALMGTYTNKDLVDHLEPAVAAAALSVVRPEEPPFPVQITAIGLSSVVEYERWLESTINLEAKVSGRPLSVVLPEVLKVSDEMDPRKLIALLTLEPNAQLARNSYDKRTLAKIDAILAAYAAKHADHPNLHEFVRTARANLAS